MHHVETDEQWNTETRFLDSKPLHVVHMIGADHVEQVADGPVLDGLGRIPRDDGSRRGIAGGRHGQLAELLGQ